MSKTLHWKKRLKNLGYTQRDFAQLLKITDRAVSKWHDNPPEYALVIIYLLELHSSSHGNS